jgi:hypothetical protein
MSKSRRRAGIALAAAILGTYPLTAQEPFDYFRNSWNIIGLKDYERGTRITPDNQLLLAEKDRVTISVGNPPTPVLDPSDARIAAMSEHVRKEYMGGYVEGIIRWGTPKLKPAIHPYMGTYTTMNDLQRGLDEQVAEDFYWYLLYSTAAQAFPEGVYYQERTAWGETIPHATGASNYALLPCATCSSMRQAMSSTCCRPCPTGGWERAGKSASSARPPVLEL